MQITRWEPFRELTTLQERMNRLFQDTWQNPSQMTRESESLLSGSFVPPVDVYENEHDVIVKMEVPGVDQKDIDIQLENNVLTVKGERKLEKEEKEENFQRVERRYGAFTRSFTLPNTVDTETVRADYEHGVLKITLAKRAEAKPKQIKVNIGEGAKQITGEVGKRQPERAA
ncbi:MAG: Hsp20/alpha crystallin family protein [Terriglobales bacterium]